jgi:cytochrome P450
MQAVHHRADLWPEPKSFRAERFLPGQEVDPYSFLPFIQGPRNCLGQYLALLEARVVLGVLSQVCRTWARAARAHPCERMPCLVLDAPPRVALPSTPRAALQVPACVP